MKDKNVNNFSYIFSRGSIVCHFLCVFTFSPVKSPATEFRFKFTEPTVRDNAAQIKERLLAWCRSKTKEYEVNIRFKCIRLCIHLYIYVYV